MGKSLTHTWMSFVPLLPQDLDFTILTRVSLSAVEWAGNLVGAISEVAV